MYNKLLFHDLQQFHGAHLYADTAGDTLGRGIFRLEYHDLHGAGLHALATADTIFLVDHVHTGLGILGDRIMLTNLHALTALDAGHGLGTAALGNDLDTAEVRMEFLIERIGACTDTFQTCHTFDILFYSKLLHNKGYPFSYYSRTLYKTVAKIAMGKFPNSIKIRQSMCCCEKITCLNMCYREIIGL